MNIFVVAYKKCQIRMFNKQNHTNIRSLYASLKAQYGQYVRIDANSRVTSDVRIGDYSYVNHSSSLQNCDVGKFCSISSGVNISPYNHNLEGITTHPIGDCEREIRRVKIGNDVLISLNATIMEGVHIGDGAVIAAGAIVTHDVGKYELWGGVPARFIRYRIEDDKKRNCLSNLMWWNLDDKSRLEYIEKYRASLDGIENEL